MEINVLHFEQRVASHLDFSSFRSAFSRLTGTKMAPDSVLMCLAVSYCEFGSLEWWQIMSGGLEEGSHAHRHGWRVLWRHTEKKIGTQLSPNQILLCQPSTLLPVLYTSDFYNGPVKSPTGRSWQKLILTFSLWKEWRKFPLSSPSSLGVPGGLLMPLKLFGEFWRQEVCNVFLYMLLLWVKITLICVVTTFTLFIPSISPEPTKESIWNLNICVYGDSKQYEICWNWNFT